MRDATARQQLKVKKIITDIRRISIREAADDVGISIGSCHATFPDILGMKHVTVKFVPKLLNFEQKQRRIEVAQESLNEVSNDPELLKHIKTSVKCGSTDMKSKLRLNRPSGR